MTLDLRLFCDSGETFNAAMDAAATEVNRTLPGVQVTARWIDDNLDGAKVEPAFSQILVHTRYNCS